MLHANSERQEASSPELTSVPMAWNKDSVLSGEPSMASAWASRPRKTLTARAQAEICEGLAVPKLRWGVGKGERVTEVSCSSNAGLVVLVLTESSMKSAGLQWRARQCQEATWKKGQPGASHQEHWGVGNPQSAYPSQPTYKHQRPGSDNQDEQVQASGVGVLGSPIRGPGIRRCE